MALFNFMTIYFTAYVLRVVSPYFFFRERVMLERDLGSVVREACWTRMRALGASIGVVARWVSMAQDMGCPSNCW